MSDIAKWGILVAAIVIGIGLIVALPFTEHVNPVKFAEAVATIISIAGDGFMFARGLINNFLSPWARSVLSGLIYWLLGKWLITYSIKVTVWVYHYIFK